jgi:glycosyltransferase involved in cell wall biosynthesis
MEFFRKLGVPSTRTRLIYPHSFSGMDGPTPLPLEISDFFRAHSPTLISVGLLEPEYDFALQIEALGRVRQTFPNAGLAIIGSGRLESELRSKISVQEWASHILLCGDVPHQSTLQAISLSNVMLRTTLYDGDAVSVREALYLGVPVIASDNGMRPLGVVLIPRQNLNALCDAIEHVVNGQVKKSAPLVPVDETNIEAVFRLYQELADGD